MLPGVSSNDPVPYWSSRDAAVLSKSDAPSLVDPFEAPLEFDCVPLPLTCAFWGGDGCLSMKPPLSTQTTDFFASKITPSDFSRSCTTPSEGSGPSSSLIAERERSRSLLSALM